MATTNSNFVFLSTSTPQAIIAQPAVPAQQLSTAGIGIIIDRFVADLSKAGYAKNGAVALVLASSTPQTIGLQALGSVTNNAGDTSFATIYEVIVINLGTHPVTLGAAASHPFLGPLGGTSPTFTVAAGAQVRWHNPAGWTVTGGSNDQLKCDPGSNAATLGIAIGGA